MKAAFVTTSPSSDRFTWSGINYSMQRALENAGWTIFPIGDLKYPWKPLFHFRRYFNRILFSQQYLLSRDPAILHSYARQVSRVLKTMEVDFVFSPGTIPIAYLETDLPIFFWTDATFAAMINYYPHYSFLSPVSIRHGHAMEQSALDRARLAIYSSAWAAQSALTYYSADPARVKTVPLGINLDPGLTDEDLSAVLEARARGPIRLLFSGLDWKRKGGDIAVRTAEILHGRGVNIELHIVGTTPEGPVPPYVYTHGFLNRFIPGHLRKLDSLFRSTHFLILPTRAECAAVVLSEASAYGIPSLTTDVGGNASLIEEGHNGYLFPLDAGAESYANRIQQLLADRETYSKIAHMAFQVYSSRLNWRKSIETVTAKIREVL
ncbi:MAG: glycosyltransferase family 4 protein [Anaerolineales bacterium]|nr:glycosyltransferase family 4 protein [Anaerolineales bacterium]